MSTESNDFERMWLAKLGRCLAENVGDEIRDQVMAGSETLSDCAPRERVIAWSKGAMERLDKLVGDHDARRIMAGCACQYPKDDLQDLRETYEATQDIDTVHQMLQARFESFLETGLQLDGDLIADIVSQGWGLAGIRDGDTIIATKIPKSGYLADYMNETDPEVKRQIYCHCPRIRDVLRSPETISATYCYCGAGYYKGIWEEILQQPVEVELLESVLQGDPVCKVAIHLPAAARSRSAPQMPTLQTERLLLRPFDRSDAADIQRLAGDRAIADTTLNVPYPYEDGMAEEWIATHQPRFDAGELVNFAMVLRETGDLIGAIGLNISQRFQRAEVGYWVGKPYWGQGYCTEAAQAVLDHAFRVVHLHRVHACHLSRNPASGRVMQKLGMVFEGRARQHVKRWDVYEDLELYGILRHEWLALNPC